ncbi:DUF4865 domain-containing protein [Phyllobacterium phragmitis]|uniref:DUF4865 domain-containing protein n=1 Tax=Phyllobacterium phragmitis TaxID=2670329 RepID=A0A2S9IU63_9HYPH|nr:DUF4865 family protein [Phyllobacterium phragmitis]PRD44066.1 DUF4865 domain-containing protein [Phyllobacterium phragmitis]
MFMKQYIHRLPADYDMNRIRERAASLGPRWDGTQGLGFKAFIAQQRGANGAAGNTYSSLYLWLDDDAATDFITSDRFQAVIDGFGRPRIETWIPLDIHLGRVETARSIYREDIDIGTGTDFTELKRNEIARNNTLARHAGTLAAVTALDLSTWRLSRFLLSAETVRTPETGSAYEVLHLSKPGLPMLLAAA